MKKIIFEFCGIQRKFVIVNCTNMEKKLLLYNTTDELLASERERERESKPVILLHEKTYLQMRRSILTMKLKWEFLPHLAYSKSLTPLDYHCIQFLIGKQF